MSACLIPLLQGPRGRPRCRPDSVLGDRAYDAERIRRALRSRQILPRLATRNTKLLAAPSDTAEES